MAKPKTPPEPDDAVDDAEPDEDEAWAQATPRLKGLFKETLDEWMTEHAPTEPAGDGAPAAGGRAGGNGAAGDAIAKVAQRTRTAPRPSGGSILDVLLGR
jgi:hypothetical protein